MAGDWIKMRVDLSTSPKVVRISSALRADRLRVIGGLHAVWCLFDVHSEDGNRVGAEMSLDQLQAFKKEVEMVIRHMELDQHLIY